jgi:fructose-1,6-bisphosphatase/inositol monophosphatase family enzyme
MSVMLDHGRREMLRETVRAAARLHVMPRFRALAPEDIATKSGPADLVTAADTAAERAILAAVSAAWPGALALGEETIAADPSLRAALGEADWAVVVDPVDGTWNFAKGLSVFGVILAVLHRGRPVWSMLYDPVMDDWIEAEADGPAHMVTGRGQSSVLATSAESRVGAMTGYVAFGLFPRALQARIVSQFPDFSRVTSLRCACHEYRMVAQGHAEFCLSGPTPHPWDHAAGILAVESAGGVARFLDGAPYEAGRLRGVILAAGSPAMWDALAARFAFLL